MRDATRWLDGGALAGFSPASEARAILVVDLDDPRVAALQRPSPSPRDRDDLARPLAGPRAHFLARRTLARAFLARWLGVDAAGVIIGHDGAGAPRVLAPTGGAFVSVAARGPVAAIAVAATPVGVDLEALNAPREPVWEALHPRERAAVEAEWRAGRDDAFIRVWTAKEAWLKLLGAGLTRDPGEVEVILAGETFRVVDGAARGAGAFRDVAMGARAFRAAAAWRTE